MVAGVYEGELIYLAHFGLFGGLFVQEGWDGMGWLWEIVMVDFVRVTGIYLTIDWCCMGMGL